MKLAKYNKPTQKDDKNMKLRRERSSIYSKLQTLRSPIDEFLKNQELKSFLKKAYCYE